MSNPWGGHDVGWEGRELTEKDRRANLWWAIILFPIAVAILTLPLWLR